MAKNLKTTSTNPVSRLSYYSNVIELIWNYVLVNSVVFYKIWWMKWKTVYLHNFVIDNESSEGFVNETVLSWYWELPYWYDGIFILKRLPLLWIRLFVIFMQYIIMFCPSMSPGSVVPGKLRTLVYTAIKLDLNKTATVVKSLKYYLQTMVGMLRTLIYFTRQYFL